MHAVYKSTTSWNSTQFCDDLVKLCTGTTDIQTLSASCDKTASEIVSNTVPADWQLHDATGSWTGQQVIKRLHATGSMYKYVSIGPNNPGSTSIQFLNYTSWNNSTHTYTDRSDVANANIPLPSGITFTAYIWVKPTYIAMLLRWSSSWNYLPMVIEVDRTDATLYSNYWAESNEKVLSMTTYNNSAPGSGSFYIPRYKSFNGTGDTTGNSASVSVIPFVNLAYLPRNNDESFNGILLSSLYAAMGSTAYLGKVLDLLMVIGKSQYNIQPLDEFLYGGKTYQCVGTGTGSTYWAIPKE